MKQTLCCDWLHFIDQACSVKMVEYWPPFLASLWTLTLSQSIITLKKDLGQYLAILTSPLVNKPYLKLVVCCLSPISLNQSVT